MEETEEKEDGISKLPEPIKHQIISLLRPKEAAKISLLSKEWLSTWHTRPNLHIIGTTKAVKRDTDFLNWFDTTLLRSSIAEREGLEDCTSKLPEDIIHHILSFFQCKPKEAARTSVLSKAWLSAWRTRPILDFNYRLFSGSTDTNIQVLEKRRSDFINCINTTLLRYHEHKNGIDKLKLTLPPVSPDHVNRWIQIAAENGVESLNITVATDSFTLPETVFEAKSLEELYLGNFTLKSQIIKTISCHNLRDLRLFRVDLDEVIFQRIMLSCPLIDSLTLSSCGGLDNIKVTKLQKLRRFTVALRKSGFVEVEAPSLEYFRYSKIHSHVFGEEIPSRNCRLQMHTCQNLKHLEFSEVGITDEFFLNITQKFPNLQDLYIRMCKNLRRIKISSHSIKHVNLQWNWSLKEAKIDVPSLDHFVYKGDYIPFFSFTAPYSGWESNIELCCGESPGWPGRHSVKASWFSKLKGLLRKLHQSEISLNLSFYSSVTALLVNEIKNRAKYPLPQVQELSICIDRQECLYAADFILDAIFWTCRPKIIVQDSRKGLDFDDTHLDKVIFENFILGGNPKRINLQNNKLWQDDIKDVKVLIFEDGHRVQLPVPLDWDTFWEDCPSYLQYEIEWENSTGVGSRNFQE